MTWNNRKKIIIQATVALVLLFSIGVSAVHTTPSAYDNTVESSFHLGDVPFITVTITPPLPDLPVF